MSHEIIAKYLKLSSRDMQSALLSLYTRILTTTGATNNQTVYYTVDADHILMLMNVYIITTAGASQTVTQSTLWLADQNNSGIIKLEERFPGVLRDNWIVQRSDAIIIPPHNTISLNAVFSAATNPNTTTMHIMGLLTPRGNFPGV